MCECERLDEAQFVRFRQLVKDEEKVDVNCTDEFGFTPLLLLCRNNHSDGLFDCVRLLLERFDIQINQKDKLFRQNALMLLCGWSKSGKILKVAQLLIEKGIDIHQTDKRGWNALMFLCGWSESDKIVEMVKLLTEKGITNVSPTSKCEENALIRLCKWSKSGQILEGAQTLINKGIIVNQIKEKDESRMNSLLKLCFKSVNEEMVEKATQLIEKGIEINQTGRNSSNITADELIKNRINLPASKKREIIALLLQQ